MRRGKKEIVKLYKIWLEKKYDIDSIKDITGLSVEAINKYSI